MRNGWCSHDALWRSSCEGFVRPALSLIALPSAPSSYGGRVHHRPESVASSAYRQGSLSDAQPLDRRNVVTSDGEAIEGASFMIPCMSTRLIHIILFMEAYE